MTKKCMMIDCSMIRYRSTENVNLPFKVHPVVNEIGKTRVEYMINVKANFSPKLYANNVILRIPTPLNSAKVEVKVGSGGKAKYAPSENCIIWKIPRFQGQAEFTLSGEAELTAMTHKRVWSRPPISMDFQVLMFTSSGLLVRFLKVFEKSGYQSVKWVRYMTKAGSYQIRVSVILYTRHASFMMTHFHIVLKHHVWRSIIITSCIHTHNTPPSPMPSRSRSLIHQSTSSYYTPTRNRTIEFRFLTHQILNAYHLYALRCQSANVCISWVGSNWFWIIRCKGVLAILR